MNEEGERRIGRVTQLISIDETGFKVKTLIEIFKVNFKVQKELGNDRKELRVKMMDDCGIGQLTQETLEVADDGRRRRKTEYDGCKSREFRNETTENVNE
jgi:hypothetical protein